MVISKLDKKDKEVLTVIGTDNFSDGFREMRDSLLEIKQNKDRFLQLLEEVDFDNYRKSFLDELEESSEEFFNKKLNKNKDDIHSIYDFFGKNYKLTSKKNGFVKDSIKNLEILGFNITKTNVCTNNKNLLIKDKDGHLRTVYFDLKEKILKSVKKSLEETIKYLLNNDFMLKDVLFQKVPISFLTDLEIIEGLRSFDQFPPLLFSKTQDRIKRKDQLIRFTLLLKDVMIENLGNIT